MFEKVKGIDLFKISFVLIVLFIFSTIFSIAFANGNSFSDVPEFHKNYDAISILSNKKILQGFQNNEFRPDAQITRAEFTAVLTRAMGKADIVNYMGENNIFEDVSNSHWATNYISFAYNEGIINGISDRFFEPESGITYEQVIKMVVAALGYNQSAIDAGGYPSGYLSVGNKIGLDNNTSGETVVHVTRGAVAQIIYNGFIENPRIPPRAHPAVTGTLYYVIELLTDNPAKEIYYTIDGSTPTIDSIKYDGNIFIGRSLTLKAIAVNENGAVSDVATYQYTQAKGDKMYELFKFANDNILSFKLDTIELDKMFHAECVSQLYALSDAELECYLDKCKEIITPIKADDPEIKKEKIICDYLGLHTSYDYSLQKSKAYDLLVSGEGICNAYADATQFLMTLVGIECKIVTGPANGRNGWEDHAWNIIKIEDQYYHIDTTWNDVSLYNYFNKSDATMRKDHRWDESFFPACNVDMEFNDEFYKFSIKPDVIGMTEYDAYNELKKYGFLPSMHVKSKYVYGVDATPGTVVTQNIIDDIVMSLQMIELTVAVKDEPIGRIDKDYIEMHVGDKIKVSANVTPNFFYEWFGIDMSDPTGTVGEPYAHYEPIENTNDCYVTATNVGECTLCLLTDYGNEIPTYFYCKIKIKEK